MKTAGLLNIVVVSNYSIERVAQNSAKILFYQKDIL